MELLIRVKGIKMDLGYLIGQSKRILMASKVQTHWQWYKGFFGIIILRYLVTWFAIVPIIAKLFSGLDLSMKLGSANTVEIHSNLTLPFSLQILWLASFFYVLALLLYHFFCPSFIKKYS